MAQLRSEVAAFVFMLDEKALTRVLQFSKIYYCTEFEDRTSTLSENYFLCHLRSSHVQQVGAVSGNGRLEGTVAAFS